jgi:type III secretion protein D
MRAVAFVESTRAQTMKQLRILTGRHGGACLDLEPGCHTLGSGAECDIVVTDWPQGDMRIVVGEDGSVSMTPLHRAAVPTQPAGDGAPARAATNDPADAEQDEPNLLLDFEPQTFGEVVICLGGVEGPWPANIELLGAALQPGADLRRRLSRLARAQWQSKPVRALIGSVAVASVALALTPLLLPSQSSSATPRGKPTLQEVQQELQQALLGAGAPALTVDVHPQTQTLEITGLIDKIESNARLLSAIDSVGGPYPVMRHYSAADTVASDIRGAVGVPNATVEHRGKGAFVFSGEVKDLAATRAAIERVARDLSPLVKSIEPKLVLLETTQTELPILSAMTVGRISITQTRDGNKHIVMGAPDPKLSVADALLTSPPGR